MKIIVTALMLCFVASVADARCAPRVVSPDDDSDVYAEYAEYTDFSFVCHDGTNGVTVIRTYGDSGMDGAFSAAMSPDYGSVNILSIPDRTKCGLIYEVHMIGIGEDPPNAEELLQLNGMQFMTIGVTPPPRDPDDKCNNQEGEIDFYYGTYKLEGSRGRVVPNPWRVFNSLIVMHLNHMHGERVNPRVPEVFIQWREDKGLTAPEIDEMKKRGEYR